MGRPREHGPQTRERLLDEAARLLDEEGVTALTVRRLSDAAEVSSRAIYSLFGGMPGLVRSLYRRGFEAMSRRYDEVPQLADAMAELVELGQAYRRASLEQRDLYGLMFERAV